VPPTMIQRAKSRHCGFLRKKGNKGAKGLHLKISTLPIFRSSCDVEEWSEDHAINSGTKLGRVSC